MASGKAQEPAVVTLSNQQTWSRLGRSGSPVHDSFHDQLVKLTLPVTLSSCLSLLAQDGPAVSAGSGRPDRITDRPGGRAARTRHDRPNLPEHDHREPDDLGETARSRARVARPAMLRKALDLTRWHRGEQTVAFLIARGRLESFEASDPAALADTLAGRAARRLEATARAALANGDADGAYAAAYDAYRMAALGTPAASAPAALRLRGGPRAWSGADRG